ncbi:MAG: ECF transporter S component [Defluviitaleaceae bacterium]|nr:ECF transporter S component [Defluviitaleaceae bacterium]
MKNNKVVFWSILIVSIISLLLTVTMIIIDINNDRTLIAKNYPNEIAASAFIPPFTGREILILSIMMVSFFAIIAQIYRAKKAKPNTFHHSSRDATRHLTLAALLTAAAVASALVINIRFVPTAPFLAYDPKDIFVVFGGFLFGPLTAFTMAVVVSFIEMVTVSPDGPYGMLMNLVSTASFVCVASFIYHKKKTIIGAITGLVGGVVFMTISMTLWNYIVVPVYMGVPRFVVRDMLLPVFMPFNLIKGGLNAAAAMLLYKPLINSLRRTGLIPPSPRKGKISLASILGALFVLATCILFILIFWVNAD